MTDDLRAMGHDQNPAWQNVPSITLGNSLRGTATARHLFQQAGANPRRKGYPRWTVVQY